MEVVRHGDIEKDLKKLRRFSAPLESLEAWERYFSLKGVQETPSIESFPGFGEKKIFKGRVVPLKENLGKSKGYRVIFEIRDNDCCFVLVYSRHGIYHSEVDLIKMIKERLF